MAQILWIFCTHQKQSPKFFLQQCPWGRTQGLIQALQAVGLYFPAAIRKITQRLMAETAMAMLEVQDVMQRYFQRATEGGEGQQDSLLPVNVGSGGKVPEMWRKKQWCYFGCCLAYRRHQSQFVATTGHPELELWAGWLQREADTPSGHWDFLQVFKAPQLNLVLQTGLVLTHEGSKTREKPCSSLLRSVFNSCFLLLNLREFKHFSYQIILKLVRHQVYSTANIAPSRNHFRGQEGCLYNAISTFEAHRMNWRVLRCAEGKGVGGLADDKQWKISYGALSAASFVATGSKAGRSKLLKGLKNNCV